MGSTYGRDLAILDQSFDRLDLGFKISDPLQDASAREWIACLRLQHQEVLFCPQALDDRFQVRHAMRSGSLSEAFPVRAACPPQAWACLRLKLLTTAAL
jgi:hypothetical protein